jgi:membrane protein required for colicin V production
VTFDIPDIIALVILLVAAVKAMFKGFVKEFMSKAGLLIGLTAALMFSSLAAPYIADLTSLGSWSNVIAFVLIFALGYLISLAAAGAVRSVLEKLHLVVADNVLGFLLGCFEGAVIVSFAVYLLRLQTFIAVDAFLADSWVVQFLEPIAPYSLELLEGAAPAEGI